MPNITLPDGTKIKVKEGTTAYKLAEEISVDLAKAAIAAKINKRIIDLHQKIEEDGDFKVLTQRDKESLDVLRHSASHVLAQAVKHLFPKVRLGIGPAIETGFYYDFDLEQNFTPEDLKKIEAEMQKIIKEDNKFERKETTKPEAKKLFAKEKYKLELIEELEAKPSIYKDGDFTDLCAGPHIPSTGRIGAVKLLKVAGAYWRGDSKNTQLQRIYGTAFFEKKELDKYLVMLEEAEKRDHRKLGKEMDLFSFHEEAPGMPFYHPKGMIILNEIMKYWREEHSKAGYSEIKTPIILKRVLWEQSGHWDHYKENMYFTKIDQVDYAVKPMNCPGGILVFKDRNHSYKELPMRLAEFGLVHRHELSGVLAGLFRVRAFTQDDAHLYCTHEQIKDEVIGIINLIDRMYKKFGFEYHVELSTRPENCMGAKEAWCLAETALEDALKEKKLKYNLNPGEGAFYGPKIDFHVKDAIGRTWQCGTIQLDFQMPEKFDINYDAKDNTKKKVAMLHRTVLGSMERFFGILIEHYAAKFPLWLAPEQVRVVTVADAFNKYAEQIFNNLKEAGIRAYLDDRSETVGAKIADARNERIPYVLLIGEKEEKAKQISVRIRDAPEKQNVKFGQDLDKFIEKVQKEICERQ